MRRSLSAAKILLIVPLLFFCSPKNAQKAGKASKEGEIRTDTLIKSAPNDLNQRIIHNSADQKTVDSLKNLREKRK